MCCEDTWMHTHRLGGMWMQCYRISLSASFLHLWWNWRGHKYPLKNQNYQWMVISGLILQGQVRRKSFSSYEGRMHYVWKMWDTVTYSGKNNGKIWHLIKIFTIIMHVSVTIMNFFPLFCTLNTSFHNLHICSECDNDHLFRCIKFHVKILILSNSLFLKEKRIIK